MKITLNDLDAIARTIYGEARGESSEGRQAVAWVIKNRIKEVTTQAKKNKRRFKGSRLLRDGLIGIIKDERQFTCWNKNSPNFFLVKKVLVSNREYLNCLKAGIEVFANNVMDITDGATRYHSEFETPEWATGHAPVIQVGGHLFYNSVANDWVF